MADYTPVYSGGVKPFTATTSGVVTGGQVLVNSGNGTVAASSGASALVVGVAAHDAGSGAKVTAWPLEGVIHELTAGAAIAANAGVVSAASGGVATAVVGTAAAAGELIGTAMTTAAGSPLKLRVQGRR